MINPNFVIVGVLFQFIGGLSYLRDTIKGKVQPNKVSWLLWSIAPLIAFTAEVKQGVGIVALSTFIVGFVPLMVFIASFVNKKAIWKIAKLDIVCGILSFLGIIVWSFTKVGNIAIFFSIIADGLAAIPTIIKSYNNPASETDLVYIFGLINAGIALLTIKNWRFENFGFPLYIFFLLIVLVFLIRFRKRNK